MEKSDLTAGYHSEGDRTPVHEEKNIDATRHVPDITDPDAGKSDEERAAIVCYIHTIFSLSLSLSLFPVLDIFLLSLSTLHNHKPNIK